MEYVTEYQEREVDEWNETPCRALFMCFILDIAIQVSNLIRLQTFPVHIY
jgi:hypothetical protein